MFRCCTGFIEHLATCYNATQPKFRIGETYLECVRCHRTWLDDTYTPEGYCLDCLAFLPHADAQRAMAQWDLRHAIARNPRVRDILWHNRERITPACLKVLKDDFPF